MLNQRSKRNQTVVFYLRSDQPASEVLTGSMFPLQDRPVWGDRRPGGVHGVCGTRGVGADGGQRRRGGDRRGDGPRDGLGDGAQSTVLWHPLSGRLPFGSTDLVKESDSKLKPSASFSLCSPWIFPRVHCRCPSRPVTPEGWSRLPPPPSLPGSERTLASADPTPASGIGGWVRAVGVLCRVRGNGPFISQESGLQLDQVQFLLILHEGLYPSFICRTCCVHRLSTNSSSAVLFWSLIKL